LNLNDPGRIAYQSSLLLPCNATQCSGFFPVVPPNHRLVIQHFIGEISFSGSPSSFFVALRGAGGAQSVFIVTATLTLNGFTPVSAFDQAVLLYFDAGQQPNTTVDGNNLLGGEITATGYMLDCTIAPCAAIAH
jgi:hypothetical protein